MISYGAEFHDALLPRGANGAVIPQAEYAVVRGLEDASDLPVAAGLLVDGRSLMPYAFDTGNGGDHLWVVGDDGQFEPISMSRLAGIDHIGYTESGQRILPLVAFVYDSGPLEARPVLTDEALRRQRVVAACAFGEGVLYPDHVGQPRSPYIIGYHVARRNAHTGEITYVQSARIGHFAMSRIAQPAASSWQVIGAS